MTDDPTDLDLSLEDDELAPARDVEPGPPRIWTVCLAVIALVGAILIAQIFAVALLISVFVAQGMDPKRVPEELPQRMLMPMAYMTLAVFTQIAVGLIAWLSAKRSPLPTFVRLGMLKPRLPFWAFLVIMVGSLLPLAAGIGAAIGLSLWIPPDGSVKTLYDRITLTTALPFLLSVSLFPGFFEELFWRGYVQRRLLARWSPWIAISVTALIFGLFHVTPHSIVNAFIVGLWLGVLAYKTDSIWPGVVCHAFINGSWNLYQVGERLFGIPEQPPMLVLIVGGAVIVVCFCASVGLIFSRRKC